MRQIVLARIDDRLIHGQIVTSWCKSTNASTILIVDDRLSEDNFTQRLLRAAAPPDIKVEIMDLHAAVTWLAENDSTNQRIILLSKTPQVMEELIKNGITLKSINLGGKGAKAGRSKLNKKISASPEEVNCLRRMLENEVGIFYQLVPVERPVNMMNILKGEITK